MGQTQQLGKRVELIPMDPHFHDISVALYLQEQGGRPSYLVHSYSQREGTRGRVAFLSKAILALGELAESGDLLYFSCAAAHQAATKRTFLEACKLSSEAAPQSKPLTVLDKKSGREITVRSLGAGVYEVSAGGPDEGKSARVESIAGGLRKLGEMAAVDGHPDQAAFPCGQSHDALVGLLLPRALNVRAALREEEAAGGRGTLAAPSQQK